MPGFDRTGPTGQGSQTGRGLGKCNPKNKDVDNEIQKNFTFGRGRGLGRGLGRRKANGNRLGRNS